MIRAEDVSVNYSDGSNAWIDFASVTTDLRVRKHPPKNGTFQPLSHPVPEGEAGFGTTGVVTPTEFTASGLIF